MLAEPYKPAYCIYIAGLKMTLGRRGLLSERPPSDQVFADDTTGGLTQILFLTPISMGKKERKKLFSVLRTMYTFQSLICTFIAPCDGSAAT